MSTRECHLDNCHLGNHFLIAINKNRSLHCFFIFIFYSHAWLLLPKCAMKKSPLLSGISLSVGYDVCSLHSLDKHLVLNYNILNQTFGQEAKLAGHLLLTLINAFKLRDTDVWRRFFKESVWFCVCLGDWNKQRFFAMATYLSVRRWICWKLLYLCMWVYRSLVCLRIALYHWNANAA